MRKEKIIYLSLWLILLLLIFQGFNYKETKSASIVEHFPESEIISLNDVRKEFKPGQGIIQITVKNISSDGKKRGGVYITVNGTIKANITTQDPKNLKVNVNDIILVKGHNLSSDATVTISDLAGNIDPELKNITITVGNLAKHFVTVK